VELIADFGGFLEIEVESGLGHLFFEIVDDELLFAVKEFLDFVEDDAVGGAIAESGAGSEASAEVKVEAGSLDGISAPAFAARDEGKDFVKELEGVSDRVSASVGPEVFGAVLPDFACEQNPRIGLVGDGDVGVGLVVPHANVVGRAVLLDEVAFEDEGFDLGLGDDPLEIADLADEAGDAGSVAGGFLEVATDAVLEG
jgi:hypothetical protein